MTQIADDASIRTIVNEVLDEQPESIEKYKNGRTNLLDFLVGQVMRITRGKADPGETVKLLRESIE